MKIGLITELLRFGDLGISEIRCDVFPRSIESIEAMRPVVQLLHAT